MVRPPEEVQQVFVKNCIIFWLLAIVNIWFCFETYGANGIRGNNQTHSNSTVTKQTANHSNSQITGQSGSKDDYLDDLNPNSVFCWPASRQPIRVFISPAVGIPGYKENYLDLLKQSYQQWCEASKGKISFVFINNRKQADITINWVCDKSMFTTDKDGTARTFYNENGIDRATVNLLTIPLPFGNSQEQDAVIKNVCLHEIGHALGLAGHSHNPNDIMAKSVQSYNTVATVSLSQRDRNTISRLYSDLPAIQARWKAQGRLTHDQVKNKVSPQVKEKFSLNNAAVKAINANDLPTAVKELQQTLQLDPNFQLAKENLQVAYYNWGLKHANGGNYEEAVSCFNKALALGQKLHYFKPAEENLQVTYYRWALKYSKEDNYGQAAIMYTKALELGQMSHRFSGLNVQQMIHDYAYCLRKLHQNDEADKWESKIQK